MRGLPIATNEENIEFNAKTEHGVPFKWVHISKVKGHGAMPTHNIKKSKHHSLIACFCSIGVIWFLLIKLMLTIISFR